MANNSKRVPFILGTVIFIVAIAAIIYFAIGPSGPSRDSEEFTKTADIPAASAPSIATVAPASAPARDLAKVDRVSSDAEKPLPPAYERALSGIIGRVVEPDGKPVPNTQVELLGGLLEFITLDIDKLLFESDTYYVDVTQQKQTTDKEGRFRFARVDPRGYYIIGVNLGKGRPALRLVDHTPMPGDSVDLGDIALDPWLTIRGTLVDEARKPIAGARIRVTNLPAIAFQTGIAHLQPGTGILVRMGDKDAPRFMWRLPKWTDQIFDKLPTPSAVTAADGTFAVEGAPSGTLTLIFDGAGIPAGYQAPIPPSKGSEKDIGEVTANRGSEVEGVVVDQNNNPVGESEVIVGIPSPLAAEYVAFLRKPIKTDAKGRFLAKGVPGRSAFFLARGPGQVDWTIDKPQEISGDEIIVKIPAPRSILVNVADGSGNPVSARIAIQRDAQELSLFPQLETPLIAKPETITKGQYRIRGLKEANYWIYARAEGYAIAKEKVKIGPEGEPQVSITVEPEFSVEVTVFGKENGKQTPLELATVAGVPENTAAEKLGFLALGSNKTNEQGVALVRALGEGKFNIVATHPAYSIGLAEAQIPGTKQATIQLLIGGEIRGTITRNGAVPEKPMMVVVAPNGPKTIQLPRTSVTDLEGKFHFSHLHPGKYKVAALPRFLNENLTKLNPMEMMRFASENADQDCEVTDEQVTEMVLDLAKGGRKDRPEDGHVRGSVFINGLAAEGDYVTGQGAEWIRPKKIEASGAFDLGRVREGDYTITVTRNGGGLTSGMSGPVATRRIKVKPTEETFVDINIKTGGLRGTVTDESGKPVSGARVRVTSVENNNPWGGGPPLRSDDNGKFEVTEIAAGAYRVTASYEDTQSQPMKVDVRDGAFEKVSIQLKPGIEVEGIFDAKIPEGTTWAWMQFQQKAADGDAGFGRDIPVDVQLEKKTFKARRLTAGTYTVNLRIFGKDIKTAYKSTEIEVPAGGLKNASLRFEELPPEEAAKALQDPFGVRRGGR